MSDFDPIKYKNMVKSLQKRDDILGWFDSIYIDAKGDYKSVFWADLEPNPLLLEWIQKNKQKTKQKKAIVIGCGIGDDAEALSESGYDVVAFDISPEAIQLCKNRYTDTKVKYLVANLFEHPTSWNETFDLVYECDTIQVLPGVYREKARDATIGLLAQGGGRNSSLLQKP